jgi:hypothetical protein
VTDLLETVQRTILDPMFEQLLPDFDSPAARVMLLAIGLQESRFATRKQYGGPARGYWQFERGGAAGVLGHRTTQYNAGQVCKLRSVAPDAGSVTRKLEFDDLLAAAFARLLLFTDPRPLPKLGRGGEAWAYYLNLWRPGKPIQRTWNGLYAQALQTVAP